MTHSTHFIYGYYGVGHTVKDHLERVLSYAQYHRQDSTYHSLCYTSHGTNDEKSNIVKAIKKSLGTILNFFLKLRIS